MKLTNKEIDDLKIAIQGENVMLGRLKRMMMSTLMIALTCFVMAITVLKSYNGWMIAAYVFGGIFAAISLMCLLSLYNGRKHLMKQIYKLEDNK